MNKQVDSIVSDLWREPATADQYGGQLFVPTNRISVNLPVIDPILNTPAYIPGPPINLSPNNVYRRRSLTIPTPYANFNIHGSEQQLLRLMAKLSKTPCEEPCTDIETDFGYEPLTDKNINDIITEFGYKPEQDLGFGTTSMPSVAGWTLQKVGGTSNRYLLVSTVGSQPKYYAGAGVILFERLYRSFNGREEPAVILFRSTLTGEYEELGGGIDLEDFAGEGTLARTSKREAKEESYNLFNLDKTDLLSMYGGIQRNIDREVNNQIYRCYAVGIAENQGNDRWESFYEQNKSLLNTRVTSSSWKETNDMKRFFLSDLNNVISAGIHGSISVMDVNGSIRTITGRTKACLRQMLNGYGFTGRSVADLALSNPRSVVNVRNDSPDKHFLVGTYSVVVQ